VNCIQGHKIAAQGLSVPVLRDEVRCATGPGRARSGANECLRIDESEDRPVTIGGTGPGQYGIPDRDFRERR
jgi:hypothetical protein